MSRSDLAHDIITGAKTVQEARDCVSVRSRDRSAMVAHMSEPTQTPPEPDYEPDQDPDADPEQLQQKAERPSQAEGEDDDGD